MAAHHRELETLRQISQIASRILGASPTHLGGAFKLSTPAKYASSDLAFTLPAPHSILSSLSDLGISQAKATQLSDMYMRQALAIKTHYERHIQSTSKAWIATSGGHDLTRQISLMQSLYTSRYVKALRECEDKSLQMSRQRVGELTSSAFHATAVPRVEQRPTFNQEALPILEEAFFSNKYPSRAEKARLAEQTRMGYRQVEVWFQNHRSRFKKSGREIKQVQFQRPRLSPTVSDDTSLQQSSRSDESALANIEAPSHAYPTIYPPPCDYDPFSRTPGHLNSDSYWPRRTAVSAPPTVVDADVDASALAERFADLSITDDTPLPDVRLSGALNSTCYPFVVVPSRAPIPALSCARTNPAIAANLHQIPIAFPPSRSLGPLATQSSHPYRLRNIMPSRISPTSFRSQRDCVHPYAHTLRPRHVPSRTPSLTSISSALSDSCSTSSSSYSPPSTPTTVLIPCLPPTDLVSSKFVQNTTDHNAEYSQD